MGLAVMRFLSLEKSLQLKGQFQEFVKVVQEYFDMGHAEPVPVEQSEKTLWIGFLSADAWSNKGI